MNTAGAAAAASLKTIGGHSPDPAAALRLLEFAARQGLDQSRREDDGTAAPAVLWHWNNKRRESVPVKYDATGAALAVSARLARELYSLDPSHAANRRLYLAAMLQSGLDIGPVITHRLPVGRFQEGFEVMASGHSGKVILDWENAG